MQLIDEKAQRYCALQAESKVLVALSGGADSVALLYSLRELGVKKLYAAHLHHGIRAEEADRDCEFCKDLCQGLNVPLNVERCDVPAVAREKRISVELAARQLRYDFLRKTLERLGADMIALGHHRGDQAETVLMHLLRGSGLKGLCGMQYRSGDCIRPLLGVSKADIVGYLEGLGQSYCSDSTNDELDATRNRVRLQLMPLLSELNPNIEGTLCSMAEVLSEDEQLLSAMAQQADTRCKNKRRELLQLPKPILTRVLKKRLFAEQDTVERRDIEQLIGLLKAQNGTVISLRDGKNAWVDETQLHLGVLKEQADYSFLHKIGTAVTTPCGTIRSETVEQAIIPCRGNEAYMDLECVKGSITVRSRRDADRFTPLGLAGSKLLSDYLTDRKVPRFNRDMPLVCDDEGIIYVAGHTIDKRVRVTKDTKQVLHLIFEEV